MAVQPILYGPSRATGANNAGLYYQQRALTLVGAQGSSSSFGFFYEDMERCATGLIPGWTRTVTASATAACVSATKGGKLLCSTSATANNNGQFLITNNGLILNISTDKWYMVCQHATSAANDAQAVLACGFLNIASTKLILAGHIKALTPTNFGVSYDGLYATSALDLGTAQDANQHTYEVYCRGDGVLRARFDEGAEVSATMSAAPSDAVYPYIEWNNGTTATNRTLTLGAYGVLFPR